MAVVQDGGHFPPPTGRLSDPYPSEASLENVPEEADDENIMTGMIEGLATKNAELRAKGDFMGAIELLQAAAGIIGSELSVKKAAARELDFKHDNVVSEAAKLHPAVAVAKATIRLLMCATFSEAGGHLPALKEACAALWEAEAVWQQALLPMPFDLAKKQPEASAAAASRKLRDLLLSESERPPAGWQPAAWLARAAEVAAQARLCAALELEYQTNCEEDEQEDESDLPLPTAAISRLYNEAAILARILHFEHPVRHTIDKAIIEREERIGDLGNLGALGLALEDLEGADLPQAVACVLVNLPQTSRPASRASQGRQSSSSSSSASGADTAPLTIEGLLLPSDAPLVRGKPRPVTPRKKRLPRYRRLYLGEPPELECKPGTPAWRMSRSRTGSPMRPGSSMTRPGSSMGSMMDGGLDQTMFMPLEDFAASRRSPPTSPLAKSLMESRSTWMTASSSAPSLRPVMGGLEPKLPHSFSGQAMEQFKTPPIYGVGRFAATRRVPVLYSCSGPGGKAQWALRTEFAIQAGAGQAQQAAANIFEDWRRNAGGPARNPVAQALESEGGMAYFQDQFKRESRRFKNFWLNEDFAASRRSPPTSPLAKSLMESRSTWMTASSSAPSLRPVMGGLEPKLPHSFSGQAMEQFKTPPIYGVGRFAATRRVPVLYSCSGPGGKAQWALRTEFAIQAGAGQAQQAAANIFEDWRRNAGGPARNPVAQALESEGGMAYFQDQFKRESRRFKNFWLNEEVAGDDMFEDRTRYSGLGVKVANRSLSKRPPSNAFKGQMHDRDEKYTELFVEFGLKTPPPVVVKSKSLSALAGGKSSLATPLRPLPEVAGFSTSPTPYSSWPPMKSLEMLLGASHEALNPKEKPGKGKKKKKRPTSAGRESTLTG
eukprot:TRINITY_DN14654_c0_g2_i1.p1 TRINITY_DN14654_c0_g2~~TRINITY_DN14654_c0_g2_i1.p1  ORF type:complete len:889 (-),score=216.42 TRINITY_DN14654_c0_g2_i1:129-2795(-)